MGTHAEVGTAWKRPSNAARPRRPHVACALLELLLEAQTQREVSGVSPPLLLEAVLAVHDDVLAVHSASG